MACCQQCLEPVEAFLLHLAPACVFAIHCTTNWGSLIWVLVKESVFEETCQPARRISLSKAFSISSSSCEKKSIPVFAVWQQYQNCRRQFTLLKLDTLDSFPNSWHLLVKKTLENGTFSLFITLLIYHRYPLITLLTYHNARKRTLITLLIYHSWPS